MNTRKFLKGSLVFGLVVAVALFFGVASPALAVRCVVCGHGKATARECNRQARRRGPCQAAPGALGRGTLRALMVSISADRAA